MKHELKLGIATREAFGQGAGGVGPRRIRMLWCATPTFRSPRTPATSPRNSLTALLNAALPSRTWWPSVRAWRRRERSRFVSSFSVFVMNKGFEQLRVTAAFPKVNLKVVGTHSGISIGEDGPTQMSVEDLSLACSLAGFTVISPADEFAMRALVHAVAEMHGPVFIRAGRAKAPIIYNAEQKFEIGKAIEGGRRHGHHADGNRPAGCRVPFAPRTRWQLRRISARVVDMHTIKPIGS